MFVPINQAIYITTGYTRKEIQNPQENKNRIQTYEFLLGCLTYWVSLEIYLKTGVEHNIDYVSQRGTKMLHDAKPPNSKYPRRGSKV